MVGHRQHARLVDATLDDHVHPGTVWLGLSALVFLLVHLPFDKAALSDHCVNPTGSDKACHPAWWLVSLGALPLLMILTSVFALREAGGVWRLPRLRR